MALVKLLLDAPTNPGWSLDLSLIHVLDLERTPYPVQASLDNGLLVLSTTTPDSLRVQVPWALPGRNPVILGTPTLPSRNEPYLLVLELARGRLTELRHFFQDGPATVERQLPPGFQEAHRMFVEAVLKRDDIQACAELATKSILLCMAVADQALNSRQNDAMVDHRLADKLSLDLTEFRNSSDDPVQRWAVKNAGRCRISPIWSEIMPVENQIHWASWETPVKLAYEAGLQVHAGPLVDFSAETLPPWIFRYDDIMQITRVVANYVFYVVRNLKNHVHVWHVVRRPAIGPIHNLTEEQQIKITVAAIQAVAQAAPDSQIVIDLTTPWAEWLSEGGFELGPLHLADTLARADLGLTGIGLELAMGYPSPGSHLREMIDISKLFDMFQLINLPLHLSLAVPNRLLNEKNKAARAGVSPDTRQWPEGITPESQKELALKLMRMSASRNFVNTIHWSSLSEASASEFQCSSIFDNQKNPLPLAIELERIAKASHLADELGSI